MTPERESALSYLVSRFPHWPTKPTGSEGHRCHGPWEWVYIATGIFNEMVLIHSELREKPITIDEYLDFKNVSLTRYIKI